MNAVYDERSTGTLSYDCSAATITLSVQSRNEKMEGRLLNRLFNRIKKIKNKKIKKKQSKKFFLFEH